MRASCTESSISACLQWAQSRLKQVTERPRLEAELLMVYVLKTTRAHLAAHGEDSLTPEQASAYRACVTQRARDIPLPYITGSIEFYGADFKVTPDVLIPRPETEGLVELALAWLADKPSATVVDVGAGSGCIAVTLARYAPGIRIFATDLSTSALAIARANAERHNVAHQITLLAGDLLAPLTCTVDLIVSNPPYVAEPEWLGLPASVIYEPRLALLGGDDGLDVIRRLLDQAREKLNRGGCLLLEIGEHQGQAVCNLARATIPDATVEILQDLAKKDRYARILKTD